MGTGLPIPVLVVVSLFLGLHDLSDGVFCAMAAAAAAAVVVVVVVVVVVAAAAVAVALSCSCVNM